MPLNPFTPSAGDRITDQATGEFTEIGRRLFNRIANAVGDVAPTTARYVLATADPILSNESNLGALASGYVKTVTAAGIATLSTAALIPVADITGLPVLTSGSYTPALTNGANVAASTAFACQFLRVGNVVTVSGRVDVDPTLTATDTQLGISLPFASNFAAVTDCAGTAWAPTLTSEGGAILADVANDRATLQWKAVDVTNAARYFSFTYTVI